MPPPSPPHLLERETELETLAGLLRAARTGTGRLVVVAGPPGVGKTRLLAAVRARASGMTVLTARGHDAEQAFPFGIALQLLEGPLAAAGPAERATLLAGAARGAVPLLDGRPWRTAEGDVVPALVHALHRLVANLATRAPVLLVVDDAHWADGPSLRLLLYLAQRVEALPVLLLVAARPREPEAPELLEALLADPAARILRPAPLGPSAVATLVRAAFPGAPDAFCAACATASGGNPLLLGELLRTLADDGVPPTADGAARVHHLAPAALAGSVLRRLGRFGPDALALARAAAVLDDGAELGTVAALAGLAPRAAAAAAGRLVAADVLAPGTEVTFAHPVLRAVVLEELSGVERRQAHADAARLLHDAGAPDDRIAIHLLAAPPAGEPWAAAHLGGAAARAAAHGAPELAARLLERALEEPQEPGDRAAAFIALGRARSSASPQRAAEAFAAALALREDPAVHLLHAEALLTGGRHDEAAEALRRGLVLAPAGGDVAKQLGAVLLALSTVRPELVAEAERHRGERVAEAGAPTPGERAVLAGRAVQSAQALEPHGRGLLLARRALDDGRLLTADGPDGVAWTLANAVLVWGDDLDGALATCDAALAHARARGNATGVATASACRATPALHAGRVAEAVADAERALAQTVDGWGMWVVLAGGVLVAARLERGDLAGARAALTDLLAAGEAPEFAGYRLHARGLLRAAEGDLEAALADHLAAGAALPHANPAALPWRSCAAALAVRLGDPVRARTLAAEELVAARAYGAPRAVGAALRAAGMTAPPDAAVPLLEDAVAVLRGSPARLELGRALVDHGAAVRRTGAHAAAREVLREALDLADRLGAIALAARAREELVAAGGRPRRAARHGAGALTPAERRVAVLAAQGRTNREIAEALVVTRKTVDWHLGRAYRKLGVNDRSRLEALLAAPPGGAGGPDDRPVGPAPDGPAAPHGPHSPG